MSNNVTGMDDGTDFLADLLASNAFEMLTLAAACAGVVINFVALFMIHKKEKQVRVTYYDITYYNFMIS